MVITIVVVTAFIGVAALVGGIAFMFRGVGDTPVEDRLEVLTNTGNVAKKAGKRKEADLLARALNHDKISLLETFVSRFLNLRKFLDQADVNIKPAHFVLIMMGLMAAGGIFMIVAGFPPLLASLLAPPLGLLPLIPFFFSLPPSPLHLCFSFSSVSSSLYSFLLFFLCFPRCSFLPLLFSFVSLSHLSSFQPRCLLVE